MEGSSFAHLPIPSTWDRELCDCYRMIARRALRAKLVELARTAARGTPNVSAEQNVERFRRDLADVSAMLDHAVAACVIGLEERQPTLDGWIRTEAMYWLYNLPPAARREKLLDPAPGPQRFLALRTRCQLLREIDEQLRWGKPSGAAVTARTP
jgi:hypothetical protein